MVVKQVIEPILEPIFLADSYGYRPNKSALAAVGATRARCWKYDWVLEFDIKGLFDIPDINQKSASSTLNQALKEARTPEDKTSMKKFLLTAAALVAVAVAFMVITKVLAKQSR
jgi:hypothetical protein